MCCAPALGSSRFATKHAGKPNPPMPQPQGVSWIEKPLLAAMALPESKEDLQWLRRHGIEVLISLTEDPLRRDCVNDTGILVVHEPIVDMEAPSPEQLDRC